MSQHAQRVTPAPVGGLTLCAIVPVTALDFLLMLVKAGACAPDPQGAALAHAIAALRKHDRRLEVAR